MRYRIRLINTETKETQLTNWGFTNRKEAEAFCEKWRNAGNNTDAEVVDTKKHK